MEQRVWIVSYDIADDKRRAAVYQTLRGWGDHLQFSVFRVRAGRVEHTRLRIALEGLIDHRADQVLFFDLGPAEGRARGSVASLGLPYTHPERHAIVV